MALLGLANIVRKGTTHCECGGQIYSASGAIDHHPRCKVIRADVEASRKERLRLHAAQNRRIKAENKLRGAN